MRFTKKTGLAAAALALAAIVPSASAYELTGVKWSGPSATFMVGRLQSPWRQAFTTATGRWNAVTPFNWSTDGATGDGRCSAFGDNIISFASTVCGYAFGATALAITITVYDLASLFIVRNEMVFNSSYSWQIYDGPLRQGGPDFRRVAGHELGHAMGLDGTDNPMALMYRYISDIYLPQSDDIAGVNAIYGVARCTFEPMIQPNDRVVGELSTDDCTIRELTGAPDDSFVDLYPITLPSNGTVTVRMDSTEVDSYLFLGDADLSTPPDAIAEDDDSGGNFNALMSVGLSAGTYIIGANSFFFPPFQTGAYTLTTSFAPTPPPSVGIGVYTRTNLQFIGGVGIIETVASHSEVTAYVVPSGVNVLLTDLIISNPNATAACCAEILGDNRVRAGPISVPAEDTVTKNFMTGIGFTTGTVIRLRNDDNAGPLHFTLRGYRFTLQ